VAGFAFDGNSEKRGVVPLSHAVHRVPQPDITSHLGSDPYSVGRVSSTRQVGGKYTSSASIRLSVRVRPALTVPRKPTTSRSAPGQPRFGRLVHPVDCGVVRTVTWFGAGAGDLPRWPAGPVRANRNTNGTSIGRMCPRRGYATSSASRRPGWLDLDRQTKHPRVCVRC